VTLSVLRDPAASGHPSPWHRDPALRRRIITASVVGIGAGGLVMAVMLLLQQAMALPVFVTSWASSTALILGSPGRRAAMPLTVGIAHAGCAIVGVSAAQMAPHQPWIIVPSFGIALCLMLVSDRLHPPAAANAVIPAVLSAPAPSLLLAMLAGAVCMAALAWIALRGRSVTALIRASWRVGFLIPCPIFRLLRSSRARVRRLSRSLSRLKELRTNFRLRRRACSHRLNIPASISWPE
jgi:hypothetical protein